MKILDWTLPTPEENLALDEALLERAESHDAGEVLRFWESKVPFVVLGYSNSAETEVRVETCRERNIPVLRRISGGGTVLQGPGCLCYALILSSARPGVAQGVRRTNETVMEIHRAALSDLLQKNVAVSGHTDLALGGRKFSGNSQRRKKNFVLFHGTFLHRGLDLSGMEAALSMPSREPEYRRGRAHGAFLTTLDISPTRIKRALARAWNAHSRMEPTKALREEIRALIRKYAEVTL